MKKDLSIKTICFFNIYLKFKIPSDLLCIATTRLYLRVRGNSMGFNFYKIHVYDTKNVIRAEITA